MWVTLLISWWQWYIWKLILIITILRLWIVNRFFLSILVVYIRIWRIIISLLIENICISHKRLWLSIWHRNGSRSVHSWSWTRYRSSWSCLSIRRIWRLWHCSGPLGCWLLLSLSWGLLWYNWLNRRRLCKVLLLLAKWLFFLTIIIGSKFIILSKINSLSWLCIRVKINFKTLSIIKRICEQILIGCLSLRWR